MDQVTINSIKESLNVQIAWKLPGHELKTMTKPFDGTENFV